MNRRSAQLVLALTLCACLSQGTQPPPPRPASVPKSAFWCGGLDGGVFVEIAAHPQKKRLYRGTIYTEAGDIWYRGDFRMDPQNPGRPPRRGQAWCGGWDGTRLYLSQGGALLAVDAEKSGNRSLDMRLPSLIEAHAGDLGKQVDASRRKTDLVHDPRRYEVAQPDSVSRQRRAKPLKRAYHTARVVLGGPHEDVDIAGSSRDPVSGHGVRAHDHELHRLFLETAEHVEKVVVELRRAYGFG